MNEQVQDTTWQDRELTPAQEKNRHNAELVPFGSQGISPQNFAQLVDFAKQMSLAKHSIPPHFRGSPGDCLAIIEIAQKFEMSAYMLARGTYFVNGAMAFEGQLISAIINKWCPLDGRLKYRFDGDHAEYDDVEVDETDRNDQKTGKKIWIKKIRVPSTRRVIVTGRMKGEAEDLVYESPLIKDIKVKNSPLWIEDPDQQLIYFATRRWQRRWWPEGLLNIYARDEIDEIARPGDTAMNVTPDRPSTALLDRLRANSDGPREGFVEGFTESHFDVAVAAQEAEQPTETAKPKRKYTKKDKSKPADATPAPASAEPAPSDSPAAIGGEAAQAVIPKDATEWAFYCNLWLTEAEASPAIDAEAIKARWSNELKLRNDCGVTAEIRDPVFERYMEIVHAKK